MEVGRWHCLTMTFGAHSVVMCSFLTAHQHILGYLVPYNDVEDTVKEIRLFCLFVSPSISRFQVECYKRWLSHWLVCVCVCVWLWTAPVNQSDASSAQSHSQLQSHSSRKRTVESQLIALQQNTLDSVRELVEIEREKLQLMKEDLVIKKAKLMLQGCMQDSTVT